jgi:hypothetical protein
MRSVTDTTELTPDERHAMRGNGIMTLIKVNGKVYAPIGGGIPSDKSCFRAVMGTGEILNAISHFKNDIEANPNKLIDHLKKYGIKVENDLNLELATQKTSLGFYEESIAVFIPLDRYFPRLKFDN